MEEDEGKREEQRGLQTAALETVIDSPVRGGPTQVDSNACVENSGLDSEFFRAVVDKIHDTVKRAINGMDLVNHSGDYPSVEEAMKLVVIDDEMINSVARLMKTKCNKLLEEIERDDLASLELSLQDHELEEQHKLANKESMVCEILSGALDAGPATQTLLDAVHTSIDEARRSIPQKLEAMRDESRVRLTKRINEDMLQISKNLLMDWVKSALGVLVCDTQLSTLQRVVQECEKQTNSRIRMTLLSAAQDLPKSHFIDIGSEVED